MIVGILCRLLLCFSALSNGQKILEVDRLPQDSIKCVHGLRFLSVAWVILVHTYLEVFAIAENKTLRVITERFFIYQTISNATFSVDTFFFIRYIKLHRPNPSFTPASCILLVVLLFSNKGPLITLVKCTRRRN